MQIFMYTSSLHLYKRYFGKYKLHTPFFEGDNLMYIYLFTLGSSPHSLSQLSCFSTAVYLLHRLTPEWIQQVPQPTYDIDPFLFYFIYFFYIYSYMYVYICDICCRFIELLCRMKPCIRFILFFFFTIHIVAFIIDTFVIRKKI